MLFISLPIMLYMVYVRNVSAHVRIVRVHIVSVTLLPITLNDTFESHKQEKINISRKLKKAHLEEKKTKAKKEIEAKKEQIQKDREELKSKKAAHEQLYEMPDGRRFNSGELTRILDQQEQVCPFFLINRDPWTARDPICLGERRKVNGHQVDDRGKVDGLESKQTSTFVSRGVI